MQISQETINDIREKNDILSLVSQYVRLEKRGRNYIGLCPFHDEKTPSFSVSPEKQICHCFGCKKGGNVFQFLEQIENITFVEAVRRLGANVGIEVASEQKVVVANDNMIMIEMHELLRDYYHYVLKATTEAEGALQYLYDRGFTDELINREKIGYSPDISHFANDFLEKRGFDKAIAYEAGLLARNEENFTYYDRFRDRIMFPINNAQGHTVGFSGRTYKNQEPKYLNSPETPIFQKRHLLYHLDIARKSIRKQDEVLLLEGFMDVIKVNEAGLSNAIATMGTALSREHQLQLKKLADNVTLMFDGDRAGLEATLSVGETLLSAGSNVYVVPLRQGMDPDEMIKELGQEKFIHYVNHNKMAYVSFKMRQMTQQVLSNDLVYEQKLNEIMQNIGQIKSTTLRKKILHEASELFKVDFDSLNFEVSKYVPQTTVAAVPVQNTSYSKQERAERLVLKHFFSDKALFFKMQQHVTDKHFKKPSHQAIYQALTGYYENEDRFNISQFLSFIQEEAHSDIISIDDMTINSDPTVDEIHDYLYVIHTEQEEQQTLQQLKGQLSEAVSAGDIETRNHLMQQIIIMNRQKKR
ncbi:DNA primase [Macrococcus hajekii]|uniref:DNA primase n=1 Tax=Macrococcus hajekii TaxID=198482 RepID=A0A4R6BME1_9STAP|nr:DNA primase [Macrococcus hajekii]TDM02888.1 DNA primase [Macrococcus hajekii]GGB04671.1 DNA primase [Macrococcus hajekii]